MTVGVQGAIARARLDRACISARMLSAIMGENLLVVEIAGMAGIFQVANEHALRSRQERGLIGTYQTHYVASIQDSAQPIITKIEYRFGRQCWYFENDAIIYDDRKESGQFLVAEGVINYIPDDVQIRGAFGRVARVSTFAEAVRLIGIFATSDTVTYEQYRALVANGITRVD